MSELTTCNYCRLKQYQAEAKKKSMTVLVRHGWRGGADIYIVPRGYKINIDHVHNPDRVASALGPDQYWKAWMAEIGTKCSC